MNDNLIAFLTWVMGLLTGFAVGFILGVKL